MVVGQKLTPTEEYLEKVKENINLIGKSLQEASSLDERIDFTNKLLLQVVSLLVKGLEQPITPKENPERVEALQKLVTTAGTAEQLPDILIPYDHEVIIKALPTNTDTVYLGSSKLDAEDHTKAFPLEAGEGVEYKIKNLSVLWIDADADGEGIVWTVEQEAIG